MTANFSTSEDLFSEQVEEVFCAAMELEGPLREAFLERTCANNPDLRKKVDTLVTAEKEAGRVFEIARPAMAVTEEMRDTLIGEPVVRRTAGLGESLGSLVGPYRLLETLGEGGCGVVYTAEQEKPVHREVALKIIKLGMDTKSVIARFDAERQALAMMDHPNIARVLDVGSTEQGRPYFVMELVRGVKITSYCDELRLDLRQRLALFIQVCHALQHAHQKGIIHRDIKASNILVASENGVPRPMIIDFGIAKAVEGKLTDATWLTPHEVFIGTPAYISPEQAQMSQLDVDTRSDIYSLGVLLYELLTGRTPFDTTRLLNLGVDEMRRVVREEEPKRPSTLLESLALDEQTKVAEAHRAEIGRLISMLQRDLDWIVVKALEKNRDRRYQTANALAADVQSYLDNEPVSARPPSRTYRFQKLVRRNKVVFISGTVVVLTVAFGFAVTFAMLVREHELRQRAVAAEEEQARLREAAEHGQLVQAELHHQEKWRDAFQHAAALIDKKAYGDADKLVENISGEPTTMEGAEVLRTLGLWNATHQNWLASWDRFRLLMKADQSDKADRMSFDFVDAAVALAESKDQEAYDAFREKSVSAKIPLNNAIIVERYFKGYLLLPTSPELVQRLKAMAQQIENATQRKSYTGKAVTWDVPWRCMTLALWEYRTGDFNAANLWAGRCLSGGENPAPRAATARVIQAMALFRMGQNTPALTTLGHARATIKRRFSKPLTAGSDQSGFWFDWAIAQLLLDEADAIIADDSSADR